MCVCVYAHTFTHERARTHQGHFIVHKIVFEVKVGGRRRLRRDLHGRSGKSAVPAYHHPRQPALRQACAPQLAQHTHRHSDSAADVTSFLQAVRRPCGFAVIESGTPLCWRSGIPAWPSSVMHGRASGRTQKNEARL